jgi:hypothetical protein
MSKAFLSEPFRSKKIFMLDKTYSRQKRSRFHPRFIAGDSFFACVQMSARANGDDVTQTVARKMFSRLLGTATIGNRYGIEFSVSDQLIERNNMNVRRNDIADGILSTIGRRYHQPINLSAY